MQWLDKSYLTFFVIKNLTFYRSHNYIFVNSEIHFCCRPLTWKVFHGEKKKTHVETWKNVWTGNKGFIEETQMQRYMSVKNLSNISITKATSNATTKATSRLIMKKYQPDQSSLEYFFLPSGHATATDKWNEWFPNLNIYWY